MTERHMTKEEFDTATKYYRDYVSHFLAIIDDDTIRPTLDELHKAMLFYFACADLVQIIMQAGENGIEEE